FAKLPFGDERRAVVAHYLNECYEAKGDLRDSEEGIIELARQKHLMAHLTAQILADVRTRGTEDEQKVLTICKDIASAGELHEQFTFRFMALSIISVFLFRYDTPPKSLSDLM